MTRAVVIRGMAPHEASAVTQLFSRNLGIVDRIAFQISFEDAWKRAPRQQGGVLVADCEGRLVGSVAVRVQRLKATQTGFIGALAVDRAQRGRGIGTALVEGAIAWLEDRGCEVIFATADRYNSPSWNIFIHHGFAVYGVTGQLKDYGVHLVQLWLAEFHCLGFGTFFLKRGETKVPPRERGDVAHYAAALLVMALTGGVQAARSGAPFLTAALIGAVIGGSVMAHEVAQRLMARRLRLATTFRVWASGLLFHGALSLLGGVFPAYGSTYVQQLDYRYDDAHKRLGGVLVAGPLVSLLLAVAGWSLALVAPGSGLSAAGRAGYTFNLLNLMVNLLPLQAAGGLVWDGRKILQWNRGVWGTLVIGALAVIALDVLV